MDGMPSTDSLSRYGSSLDYEDSGVDSTATCNKAPEGASKSPATPPLAPRSHLCQSQRLDNPPLPPLPVPSRRSKRFREEGAGPEKLHLAPQSGFARYDSLVSDQIKSKGVVHATTV